MNGSIRKRGDAWELTIDLGRHANGKRNRKFVTVKGSKAEAQRQLREFLSNLDKGTPINTSKTTVIEYLDVWMRDYAETNCSARTVEGYRGIIRRYLIPNLGQIRLTKLTPRNIQGLYSDMLGKGLSARTVLHTHRLLSEALKHAVKWGMVARNICESVDPPRPKRKEMRSLDTTDVQTLLEATSQTPYGSIYFLALYTGLRRAEVLGLRWCDLDLKNGTLSVNQTVVRILGKGLTIGEPKTAYSRRLVSLSPSASALLGGLRNKRAGQLQEAGLNWDEMTLVFCNSDGGPISPDTVTHAFSKIIKRLGLPYIRFHDLRHTHATLMLKQGIHPKIVSERLGHSSINITLDTYSHVLPGMQETAALAFEEAVGTAMHTVKSNL